MSDWERPIEVLSSSGVKELRRLQAENAKLRELLSESLMDYKLYAEKYGLQPYISDVNEHLDARMSELGVEA